MVMIFKRLKKDKKGASRILEAVIAGMIIFIVFTASLFLLRSSNVKVLGERADLDRLGYNVLNRIVESGTIEATLERYGPGFREALIKTVVQRSLPSTTCFKLMIFNCTDGGSVIQLQQVSSINNTSDDSFNKSLEVSSTSVIYTSKKGSIYHLVLLLVRPGGG